MQTKTALFAALTLASVAEFLSAYPFNVESVGNEETGESLLVSNLQDSFQLDFAPLRIDGEEVPLENLFEKLGENDPSIKADWILHAQRERFIERQTGNPTEMPDEEWEKFISKSFRRELSA